MKRFFASVGGSSDPSKRARGDGGAEGDAGAGAGALDAPTRQPKSFMTWNCNSFLGRMRKELDKKSFLRYVEDHDPDIIALQETWLPAAAPDRYDARRRVEISRYTGRVPPVSVACLRPTGRISRVHGVVGTPTCFTRRPARRPSPARRERLTRNTYSYDVTRASLRFPKSRGELRDDTKQYREDKSLIDLVMRQRPLSRYRAFWACADIKRAGCGVLVKKDVEPPKRVTRSLESSARRDAHDEGRVLLLEFSELVFLNVYAQNNGWTAESMAKRRAWDEQLRRFLVAADDDATVSRAKPSRPVFPDGTRKPLIWTGDLNACHREVDVSHPAFFANQKAEGKNGKTPVALPADPDDRGQPGFTVNERKRFDALVKDAGLVDAYRELHGDAEMRMTWFGHPGVTQVGKYRGKGMRLDYFFVDGGDFVRENVESCVQATDGIPVAELAERPDRAFFGSDHCAVLLRLKSARDGGDGE